MDARVLVFALIAVIAVLGVVCARQRSRLASIEGAVSDVQKRQTEELNLYSQQLQQLHSLINSLLLTQKRERLLDGMLGYLRNVIPNSACAVYLSSDYSETVPELKRLAWYSEGDIDLPDNSLALKSASSMEHLTERSASGLESRQVSPIVFQSRAVGVVDIFKPAGMHPNELKMYRLLIDYVSSFWVLYDMMEQREEEATVDPLTGIWNRRYMIRRIQDESGRITRYGGSLCVVMGDMGNFKSINDHFGHAKGDEVLIKVAETLKKILRTSDCVARYGGDEFLMLLPNISKPDAEMVLKRVKTVVERLRIGSGNDDGSFIDVFFDFGTAIFPDDGRTLMDTVALADENMYAAKTARKNVSGLASDREADAGVRVL